MLLKQAVVCYGLLAQSLVLCHERRHFLLSGHKLLLSRAELRS